MNSAVKIIKRLKLSAKRKLVDLLSGNYLSNFKGQGIEFDDLREYVAGDSVRDIDWNATAKTGNVYIRKYIETRELKINFLIDASASMCWGSSPEFQKIDLAMSFIYLIIQIAVRNGDKFGASIFRNGKKYHVEPRKARTHFLKIHKKVNEALKDSGMYNHTSAEHESVFKGLLSYHQRRSLCFFLTDLIDTNNAKLLKLIAAANKKHEIIIVQIFDIAELNPSAFKTGFFKDSETGEEISVSFNNKQFLKNYQNEISSYQKKITDYALKNSIDVFMVNTRDDIAVKLIQFFQKRIKLRYVRH